MVDYDLCVIGGGINGTGIARDAAGRGGCHAAKFEFARALHHKHTQYALALNLQRDCTVEFEALRNQPGRRRGMTECFGNERIVIMVAQHAAPCS